MSVNESRPVDGIDRRELLTSSAFAIAGSLAGGVQAARAEPVVATAPTPRILVEVADSNILLVGI